MSSEINDDTHHPLVFESDDRENCKEKESTLALIEEHLKNPRKELWEHEKQRLYILSQCSSRSNVLYADFRADEICFAYQRFKNLGLTLKELFAFQNKVPVVYPWNSEYDTLRQDVNRRFNVFPLMIVMAKTSCDVVCSYKFARQYNIPIRLRGGSHSLRGILPQ